MHCCIAGRQSVQIFIAGTHMRCALRLDSVCQATIVSRDLDHDQQSSAVVTEIAIVRCRSIISKESLSFNENKSLRPVLKHILDWCIITMLVIVFQKVNLTYLGWCLS